jgi:hypothetical protein
LYHHQRALSSPERIAVFPALTVKAQWTDTAPDGLEPQVAERPGVCSPGQLFLGEALDTERIKRRWRGGG